MSIESDRLPDSIDDLHTEVRVLREAVDELREVLEWQSHNRLPTQSVPVLKGMAANPSADDWSARLKLETGIPAIVEQRLGVMYRTEIQRLHELLDSLIDCPELNESNTLTPITRTLVAEAHALLLHNTEDAQSSKELPPPNTNATTKKTTAGRLF